MKKNISADNIFYYIPKTNSLKRNTMGNETKEDTSTNKNNNNFSSISGFNGSSTFDYFNDLNKNQFALPKIKSPFLSQNLRNKKVRKNIENKMLYNKIMIDPIRKLRLSNSCDLFNKLTKSYDIDKESLKDTSCREILFDGNYGFINTIYKNYNINKRGIIENWNNKFKDSALKYSVNNDCNNNYKYNNTNSVNKNNVKGLSKHYINFLYNRIFPKIFIEHNNKFNIIDNKLNIFYAENDVQFKENLIKRNKYLVLKGKPAKEMYINSIYIKNKLKDVKRKVGFLKGVTDYSFPTIILLKVRSKNKLYKLNRKNKEKVCLPYEEAEKEIQKLNKIKEQILSKTIIVENEKNVQQK